MSMVPRNRSARTSMLPTGAPGSQGGSVPRVGPLEDVIVMTLDGDGDGLEGLDSQREVSSRGSSLPPAPEAHAVTRDIPVDSGHGGGIDGYAMICWREVSFAPCVDPSTGFTAILITEADATGRAETEAALMKLNEVGGITGQGW